MNHQSRQTGCSEMPECDGVRRENHEHRAKFSEGLLNKSAILCGLGIIPGQIILDAGCGNGYMSKEFSKFVGNTGKVYAVDLDKRAIEELRRETVETNILAMVGDITQTTPLPSSTLDLAYLSTVIHGLSNEQIKGFETEVRRVLKPKAKLAIVEIAKRETPFGPPLRMRFSPQELKSLIGLAPLGTVSVGEHFYMQLFENRTDA